MEADVALELWSVTRRNVAAFSCAVLGVPRLTLSEHPRELDLLVPVVTEAGVLHEDGPDLIDEDPIRSWS
jgi:hypothetical protein